MGYEHAEDHARAKERCVKSMDERSLGETWAGPTTIGCVDRAGNFICAWNLGKGITRYGFESESV